MMLGSLPRRRRQAGESGAPLLIGEGIETALSGMQMSGHPAWAALSTSGLRALDLPEDVRDIIVLADGDDAGEAAALDCGWRWKREGRRVRIARPPTREGFQRHADGPRAPHRGGRAMNDEHAKDPFADAEEIHDPLEDLVERTKTDPGAPFAPDVLAALAALKKADRAAFETLRARLKKADCRVTTLDKAIAEASGDKGGRGPTQADILIELARPPNCSIRRTEPALPISTSMAIARPGRSAARASAAGWPAASSRRRRARPAPRRCSRR